VAEITVVDVLATVAAEMKKKALVDPGRTVTLACMRATSTKLLDNMTTTPAAGASRVNVTAPSDVP
jgi:hypothetical protein